MGTNTRQRVVLIGHPLSLHHIGEGLPRLLRFSAPHPSPVQTGDPHLVRARQHLLFEWDGTRVRMCFYAMGQTTFFHTADADRHRLSASPAAKPQ